MMKKFSNAPAEMDDDAQMAAMSQSICDSARPTMTRRVILPLPSKTRIAKTNAAL